MLAIRVGENIEKRSKAKIFLGAFDVCLKGLELEGLKQYFGADIFGGVLRIKVENWNQDEEARSILYKNLDDIKESQNIFLIDEIDILDVTFKKISKYCSAENVFDCREVKEKDSRSFDLANILLRNTYGQREAIEKKRLEAWTLYNEIIKTEAIESVLGAVNYKFKMYNMEKEVSENNISLSLAHDGLVDAKLNFERYILSCN